MNAPSLSFLSLTDLIRVFVYADQKRQQLGSMMQKDFALHQSARLAEKRQEGQLRNARKACHFAFLSSFVLPPPFPRPYLQRVQTSSLQEIVFVSF